MLGIKRLGLLAALVLVGVAPAAAAQAAAQPSEQDTQYLQAVHQVNLYEIAAGELAQQKGQNQQVKELGQQFVTDHTELDQSVQDLAGQLNVDLPSEPTTEQQAGLDQLNNASGEEFDRLWVTQELAGHVQAIQATQTEISQGTEPQVVQLAQTALPVLQAHYDALVMLAEELGIPVPETSPSGTASPGGTVPAPGGTTPAPGETFTEEPVPGGTVTETPVPQQS
ncbi:DUF4142 domain-containing protein [Verrucosispora sp. WMMA2044]|uniref:DUF4142 domain-containing protein n=1 Tax=Verrucosispora sioxanthis TaxID=2499994 RepID=A0A6M1LAY7_9ACTN|nr:MULTISPECIES: DUF4142 domain-containing protein [Micromonospora]NEE66269.1 DUF4142 domain-containing protein [Verrucosispora sioxanthis]NGM15379.1 DUF4142 domain-containing protein [Verrucosispora sioxanthis]WBB49881.1 DUF4142 domain-containing protein [Verrucosispora sp. WMMA2044]